MTTKQLPAKTETNEAEAEAASPAAEAMEKWRPLWWLPCELSPQVPVAQFTVRELLRLHKGGIVATVWSRTTEVPLYVNGQLIGWTELDAVGEHIGARITELV
jgi:flagellar motor switch/type III secretory pathway protein FliN